MRLGLNTEGPGKRRCWPAPRWAPRVAEASARPRVRPCVPVWGPPAPPPGTPATSSGGVPLGCPSSVSARPEEVRPLRRRPSRRPRQPVEDPGTRGGPPWRWPRPPSRHRYWRPSRPQHHLGVGFGVSLARRGLVPEGGGTGGAGPGSPPSRLPRVGAQDGVVDGGLCVGLAQRRSGARWRGARAPAPPLRCRRSRPRTGGRRRRPQRGGLVLREGRGALTPISARSVTAAAQRGTHPRQPNLASDIP